MIENVPTHVFFTLKGNSIHTVRQLQSIQTATTVPCAKGRLPYMTRQLRTGCVWESKKTMVKNSHEVKFN